MIVKTGMNTQNKDKHITPTNNEKYIKQYINNNTALERTAALYTGGGGAWMHFTSVKSLP